jgi:hypothetical protein
MVTKAASGEPPVRPYFIPPGIDFEALPESVRVVFQTVVAATYDDLVLSVEGPLERSAGVTLVFLLSVEVLEQFQLGQQLNFTADPNAVGGAERDRLIGRYLRVVGAKQKEERFLLRIHDLRARNDAAAGLQPRR